MHLLLELPEGLVKGYRETPSGGLGAAMRPLLLAAAPPRNPAPEAVMDASAVAVAVAAAAAAAAVSVSEAPTLGLQADALALAVRLPP